MKTNEFRSVKSDISINKCLEYSDNKEELKSLLNDLDVKVKFTGIRKYFPDDKEERLTGIFQLINKTGRIEFDFGFSLKDTVTSLLSDRIYDIKLQIDNYAFRKQIHTMIREDWVNKKPAELLKMKKEFENGLLYDCLTTCKLDYYISGDFDEFCSEFGYSNDSIKAEQTWKICLKQSNKLRRIFTDKEIDCLPS